MMADNLLNISDLLLSDPPALFPFLKKNFYRENVLADL